MPRGAYRWCGLSFVMLLAGNVSADDWAQWRGGQRDGVWREEGLVNQLPDGQLPLKWSAPIGPGYSGPTVADGCVYVTDRQVGKETAEQERVLCFDEQTGKLLWQHAYAASYRNIGYSAGPRAAVTVDRGLVYAVGAMGHFHCLNAKTGAVVWKHELQSEYNITMPEWGIAGAPLIYRDLVIQHVGGENACVVAFNVRDGKEVWRALSDRPGYSSPIVIQQAGQDVVISWTGDSLSALDPLTGKVHWSHPFKPSRMPIGIATPVLSGDLLFVTSFYDGSLMVRVPRDRLAYEVVWREVGVDEQHTESLHGMIGTPVVKDGYIYGADSYGEFRCLDAKTGQRIWEDLNAVPKNRWATIHMVEQADRVWMFNERGELLITKLSPEKLTIIDRAQLIEPTLQQLSRRGGVCWSHPAYANRCVFARNDSKLVCASLAAE